MLEETVMKNKDVLNLFHILDNINIQDASVHFKYFISINKQILTLKVETLKQLFKPSEEILEFEQKRVIVCEEYCEKENGIPKKEKDTYIIEKDKINEFNQKMNELIENNKELLEKEEENVKQINILLEKDSDTLLLETIDMSYIPESIKQVEMDMFVKFQMIKF